MKYICEHCRNQVTDSQKFCDSCGSQFKQITDGIDPDTMIRELAYDLEEKGVRWCGTDASLEVSMGEQVAYFPDKELLVINRGEYEIFAYGSMDFRNVKDTIKDALDMDGEGIASFVGQSVSDLWSEVENAEDVCDLLSLVMSVDMYNGLFSEQLMSERVGDFVEEMRSIFL